MRLGDLLDVDELARMRAEGYVKVQEHPDADLEIYNYTHACQWDRAWNDVTRLTRGLIVRRSTGVVIARPFPKFFNVGELTASEIPNESFEVFEKLDGSLGILYPSDYENFGVATRGSFSSDQARHASDVFNVRYALRFAPKPELTYLFEIIYPSNRIVVDYQGMDDLVLLDVLVTSTGASVLDEEAMCWPGPVVKTFPGFGGLDELLAAPQRDGEEGYVIHFAGGMRAKVKHDEYVRLHRILTGVSTKTIWEHLSSGRTLDELIQNVPDEFYDWVKTIAATLHQRYDELVSDILNEYDGVDRRLPAFASRRDFADLACRSSHQAALFRILDNKPIDTYVWKLVRPAYEKPFMATSEDVA